MDFSAALCQVPILHARPRDPSRKLSCLDPIQYKEVLALILERKYLSAVCLFIYSFNLYLPHGKS